MFPSLIEISPTCAATTTQSWTKGKLKQQSTWGVVSRRFDLPGYELNGLKMFYICVIRILVGVVLQCLHSSLTSDRSLFCWGWVRVRSVSPVNFKPMSEDVPGKAKHHSTSTDRIKVIHQVIINLMVKSVSYPSIKRFHSCHSENGKAPKELLVLKCCPSIPEKNCTHESNAWIFK